MNDASVIYEVNLDVEPGIARDFESWLQEHVQGMLALQGFRSARIFTVQDEAAGVDDAPHRFTVHYLLENQAALDRYLAEDAPRMRQEGLERFGHHFIASRRVMNTSESRDLVPVDSAQHCLNCHAPMRGQYCAQCGQRSRDRLITLWELTRDVLGDLVDMDSRLWRSLLPLMFRPGLLTRDYLLGRRARYMPPFRMYLILSLLFFLLVSIISDDSNLKMVSGDQDDQALSIRFDGDKARAPQGNETKPSDDDQALGEDADRDCEVDEMNVETGIAWLDGFLTKERVENACRKIKADDGRAFIRALVENIPTTLFVFLPLIALTLKLLYPLSGKYYVEHLLFVLHFHAFVFLILIMELLALEAAKLLSSPSWMFTTAVSIYIPVYLYRSMRRVYQQGTFATLAKYILLMLFYLVSLVITLSATTALTALTL
jgi:quinol monooxygenase YgiN